MKKIEEITTKTSLWLKRPFPLIKQFKVKAFYILFFGAFISLFIILFKPFGFYNIETSIIQKIAIIFGASSATSLSIASFVLPKVFSRFFIEEQWNIGRQMLFLISFYVLFTGINWMCYLIFGINQFTILSPLSISGISFLLGIIPCVLFILISEQRYYRSLRKMDDENIATEIKTDYDLHLFSSNKKLKYSYHSSDIICLKGCGNYYIIYYENKETVKQQIIRNTLISVEEILNKKPFLRCHKSYILNCEKIDSVKGNSKDLKIHIEKLDFEIPISRNISEIDYLYIIGKAKNIKNIEKVGVI